MRVRIAWSGILLASWSMLTGIATAQDAPPSPDAPSALESAAPRDANADATRAERRARERERAEARRGERPRPVLDTMFRRLDVNQDNVLESAEIPAERRQMFRRLVAEADANHDRQLTREEFDAGMAKLSAQLQNRFRDAISRPGEDAWRGERDRRADRPMRSAPSMFRALDTDGDGTISAEELSTSQRSLKRLDRNGDGALTADEIGAMPMRPARPTADRRDGDRLEADRERPERARRDPDGPPNVERGERGERGEFRGPGGPGSRGAFGPPRGVGGGFGPPNAAGPPFGFGRGRRPQTQGADSLPPAVEEFFNALDHNGDGQINRQELRELFRAPGPDRRPEGGTPPGPRTGSRRPAVEI